MQRKGGKGYTTAPGVKHRLDDAAKSRSYPQSGSGKSVRVSAARNKELATARAPYVGIDPADSKYLDKPWNLWDDVMGRYWKLSSRDQKMIDTQAGI